MTLPPADGNWGRWLADRCSRRLADARAAVESLTSDASGAREPLETIQLWNDVTIALGDALSAATVLIQVHPDDSIRSQAETAAQEAKRLATDISLDRAVYDVLAGVESAGLDRAAARALRLALRDFARAGVDGDEPTRRRLRDLSEQETVLGQRFSKNIRDDVRSIYVEPSRMGGLPQDYVDAHPPDHDGRHRVTTDYPDVLPFLAFAHDREARRELYVAFLSRGWPDNDAVLRELLDLRDEHATLLGFDDWASYDADVKMIGSAAAIGAFIDEIAGAADRPGRRDRDIVLHRLRHDHPDAGAVDRADATYYAEVIRRERYGVDAQQVRRYFDFEKVRAGLLEVTGRLFGLVYTPVPEAGRWHRDVAVYDVAADGRALGRIYLDLHPREGKFKHAAQFDLVSGVSGRQLAEGVLVCNVPRELLEHRDVVTLFHEFGHLIHHVVAGGHEWVRFSGVATEWDFVEAPSQLLEEWAWDVDVLRSFATDESGEPIPAELVARMRAANDFGRAYQARTQLFFASVSYRLHQGRVDDIDALIRRLEAEYDLFAHVEGTHFQASFGHLETYTSAYYTYMWSLVIAKDLFSAFAAAGLFDAATARRYRDTVLAAGGSRDAAALVADFLGRPYDSAAFTRWLEASTQPRAAPRSA
ncbi:MAG: thimet oligopeptidase [Nocardioidaceae bacterium]|nr:thimet oligopeptidase [Nocardioidaceae bacterium]